jgi:hypothetical protein
MSVRFLLDENMESQVYHRLDTYGYQVEFVGDVPTLGLGATDDEIVVYSVSEFTGIQYGLAVSP